ncbi:MAG: hypothetical protein KGJ02_03175 [Verrucomicrobiota bacterium]|nr:hypothetical protein [Verrucomicrobiota bacterium]
MASLSLRSAGCPPLSIRPPPPLPFISGDAFRAYADHSYDEGGRSLDPLAVQAGHTIFVNADYLLTFFSDVHPFIQHPYILISHNSDFAMPGPYRSFLDDPRFIAWFVENCDGTIHHKLHPIPIGISNFKGDSVNNPHAFVHIKRRPIARTKLLYLNFSPNTYPPERQPVYDAFCKAPFCWKSSSLSFERYLADLSASKFVLCPRGSGLDTYRLWESLYMGAIPIVRTSTLDPLYADLPVLIVSDWSQVTKAYLEQVEEEFRQRTFAMEKLSIDYWLRLINNFRNPSHR